MKTFLRTNNLLHFNEIIIDKFQLQNALRSFVEVVESYPAELQNAAKFSQELDPTDDTGKTLAVKDFVSVSSQMQNTS